MDLYHELPCHEFDVSPSLKPPSSSLRPRMVRDDMVAEAVDENEYYERVKLFFARTLKTLDSVGAEIEKLKNLGLEFAKSKNPDLVNQAKSAVEVVQGLLDESIYRNASAGWDSPLYYLLIFAGRHCDQLERMPLGTWRYGSDEAEKMSVSGLKLDALDITRDAALWLPLCEEALAVIRREKDKIDVYLRRIDAIVLFGIVHGEYGAEGTNRKGPIIFQDPFALQKGLCTGTAQYLDLQKRLLQEIQKLAEERARAAADEKKDLFPTVFSATQLADEINRIASHASFYYYLLLHGYWGGPSEDFPRAGTILFNTGSGEIKKTPLAITAMTTTTLLAKAFPGKEHWDLSIEATLSDPAASARAAAELEASLKRIEEQKAVLEKTLALIPARSPFPEKLLNASIIEMKEKLKADSGLKNATAYATKPTTGLSATSALFLITLDNAYVSLLDDAYNLRTILIARNRLFYADDEYRRLAQEWLAYFKRFKALATGIEFNAKRYFERGDAEEKEFMIVLDERGKRTVRVKLFGLNEMNRFLRSLEEYLHPLNFDSVEMSNRFVVDIDILNAEIMASRSRIQFLLGEIMLAEARGKIEVELGKKTAAAKKPSAAPLEEAGKAFLALERRLLTQIEFYAWAAVNSFYPDRDRALMNEHIAILAAGLERSCAEDRALLKQAEKVTGLAAAEKTKLKALITRTEARQAGLKVFKGEKGESRTVNTPEEAEKLFQLISGLKPLFAEK